MRRALPLLLVLALAAPAAGASPLDRDAGTVRIATFNTALSRSGAGLLERDVAKRDTQVRAVAEVVLRVRPDVLVLQEFDRDPEGRALDAFARLLAEGLGDLPGLDYPFRFQGRVNSGEPSGIDLDGDGSRMAPGDAWGYGVYPGHYGMALLSRLPLGKVRSYRLFPWSALPGAQRPHHPDGRPYHDDATWAQLRLSSKAHWSAPLELPDGRVLHLVTAHPTPPVFDGPEDRNGARNADEIRLITAILDGADWLRDDAGDPGGLDPGAAFVVAGDLNADPVDGEARRDGIRGLLGHPRVHDPRPQSVGAAEAAAAQGGSNARHAGPAATDTADWNDGNGPGNLRVDYLLPSRNLEMRGAGVFWPESTDPAAALVGGGREPVSSDHRLVWLDIVAP
ncbi:endonuclease/exonuclease/phosphatase family protein [Limibaculum sp. M0105]|uniref:Endonuclease/exonuclease/phosphatase family protein n=1 Tax=Thermohalobaculum xanthum TaxID=2753746 RepID=A0A8J7M9N6_9RHOB|nr:endonuclease/exonuclease/phosphatase family protein [Thermohalobaculum xanthum]MBK0399999.1 endonuclease/exonuclease/phosphatase family protein [Thermohalobaculum xanthum]